ncbi:MAG: DUF1778 domain-containing protein [Acidobacteriota bacterium]
MPIANRRPPVRTSRLNIRATTRQENLIRTGAETAGLSVTEFILESACQQAEHILSEKQTFIATPKQWQAFAEALDRPAMVKPELALLLSQAKPRKRTPRK